MLLLYGVFGTAIGLGVMLFVTYEYQNSPEKMYAKQGYTIMTADAAKQHEGTINQVPQKVPGTTTYLGGPKRQFEAGFDEKEASDFLEGLDSNTVSTGPITNIEWFGSSMVVTFENGCAVTRTWDVAMNPGKISPLHDISKECEPADLPHYL